MLVAADAGIVIACLRTGRGRDCAKQRVLARAEPANGRFCCKSPFALVIKNFPGFRCDFRVKMWGTSSSDDKLADDLGNAIEGKRIGGRRFSFFTAGNLAPGNRGLLQQYRSQPELPPGGWHVCFRRLRT